MKAIIAIIVFLFWLAYASLADVVTTNIVVQWEWEPPQEVSVPIYGTTNFHPIPNVPDTFWIYSTTNLNIGTNAWPLYKVIPGAVTNAGTINVLTEFHTTVEPGVRYFTVAASNSAGLGPPSDIPGLKHDPYTLGRITIRRDGP